MPASSLRSLSSIFSLVNDFRHDFLRTIVQGWRCKVLCSLLVLCSYSSLPFLVQFSIPLDFITRRHGFWGMPCLELRLDNWFYMATTWHSASDENKGASAGCGEFTLYARTKRDGTTKYKTIKTTVEFSSARPVQRDGNHCEKQLRQLLTSSSVQGWRLRTRPGLCTRMKKRDK